MDNNTEMYIVLACTTVFVVIMMLLINIITHHKEKKFINIASLGIDADIVNEVNKDTNNFLKYQRNILKQLIFYKKKEISIAEKTDILTNFYSPLNEFLEFRERVKRFEL